MRIEGSVVLISGASSGLGAACVHRMLDRGAMVIGLDRSPAPEDRSGIAPSRYLHVVADVTDELAVQTAIATGMDRFGKLSSTICCAGVLHGERLVGRDGPASLDAFRRVIEVNVVGTFNVVRLAADAMAKCPMQELDGERGVILMTSSIAAYEGQVGQAAYAASKGAVASMTLPLARELGRLSIRVVSLAPGVFETPMMQVAPDKVRQPLLDQSVFPKRFGLPDEFAALAQHVIENAMINGSVIRLDAALRM